jgi:hypothetical protein
MLVVDVGLVVSLIAPDQNQVYRLMIIGKKLAFVFFIIVLKQEQETT